MSEAEARDVLQSAIDDIRHIPDPGPAVNVSKFLATQKIRAVLEDWPQPPSLWQRFRAFLAKAEQKR